MSCQSVVSTALRLLAPAEAKARPGRSVPWTWVAGLSSTKTRSVTKLANFSSPSLRKKSALRPSPTKTKASWGTRVLRMIDLRGEAWRAEKARGDFASQTAYLKPAFRALRARNFCATGRLRAPKQAFVGKPTNAHLE